MTIKTYPTRLASDLFSVGFDMTANPHNMVKHSVKADTKED